MRRPIMASRRRRYRGRVPRRVPRILLNTLTLVSLLLAIGVAAIWARSYRMTDQLEWRSASGYRGIGSAGGRVVIQLNPSEWQQPAHYGWHYLRMSAYTAPSDAVA